MDRRSRVRMALNHQEPDRVPMDLGGTLVSTIHASCYQRVLDLLGLRDDNISLLSKFSNTVIVGDALRERLDVDFINLRMKPTPNGDVIHSPESYTDEWAIRWKKAQDSTGIFYPVGHPMQGGDLRDVEQYHVPDLSDPARVLGLAEYAKKMYETTDYALIADGNWLLMQKGYDLLSIEDFLCDMLVDRAKIDRLLQRICDSTLAAVRNFVGAVGDYVEVVTVADDLGSQQAPMISPELYREVIKPYHKMIVDEIRKYTRAKVMLHSDGAIAAFLPDIIDAGFDIINPVQTTAAGMNAKHLKQEYGKDLCFWGGADTQYVLPLGSPDEVRAEVRQRMEDFAPGGGYIFGTVHIVTHEVNPENVVACFDAARKYGVYPR